MGISRRISGAVGIAGAPAFERRSLLGELVRIAGRLHLGPLLLASVIEERAMGDRVEPRQGLGAHDIAVTSSMGLDESARCESCNKSSAPRVLHQEFCTKSRTEICVLKDAKHQVRHTEMVRQVSSCKLTD